MNETKRRRTNGKEAQPMFSVNWEIESFFGPLFFFASFSLSLSLSLSQASTCRLKVTKTIDWSSKRWECVTGSASHHKTNDPGPFAYIHTRRNRVCLCNDEFRARVYIHITAALPFNHFSHFFFFFFFPLSYVLSCRNLMHTHIHTIDRELSMVQVCKIRLGENHPAD